MFNIIKNVVRWYLNTSMQIYKPIIDAGINPFM